MSTITSFNHLSAELPNNGNQMMWKAAGVFVLALAVFGLTRNQDAAADGQGSRSTTSALSGQSFTPDDRFTGYLEVMANVAKKSSTVCQNTSKNMGSIIGEMRQLADTSQFSSFLALHESLESVKRKAQESGCL
jgi:hypothetical protein